MTKGFDEQFSGTIKKMQQHMDDNHLTRISFIDGDFWEFTLKKCSEWKIAKLKRAEKKWRERA